MILCDDRWFGYHGIGRFAAEVINRLPGTLDYVRLGSPLSPLDPLRLWAVCANRAPSVFFSPGFNAPIGRPVPFVFTIHDLIHVHAAEERSMSKAAYYRGIVRPACRRASYVLTVSEYSKGEICEWSGVDEGRVRVVGNGVSAEFNPGVEPKRPGYPYLLYVGNQKPHKNIEGLLRALARADVPEELYLVMTGRLGRGAASVADRLGIRARVTELGFVAPEALPQWYCGARALVIPSLYEGFGLPAVEAMATGTPVLAANRSALPEVVGDAAVKVDPTDVDSMALGIAEVLRPEVVQRLRSAGLQRAQRYSWDRVGMAVSEVLGEVSGRS